MGLHPHAALGKAHGQPFLNPGGAYDDGVFIGGECAEFWVCAEEAQAFLQAVFIEDAVAVHEEGDVVWPDAATAEGAQGYGDGAAFAGLVLADEDDVEFVVVHGIRPFLYDDFVFAGAEANPDGAGKVVAAEFFQQRIQMFKGGGFALVIGGDEEMDVGWPPAICPCLFRIAAHARESVFGIIDGAAEVEHPPAITPGADDADEECGAEGFRWP